MEIKKTNLREEPFRKSIGYVFVCYWAVLVLWQNFGGVQTRSSIDVLLKIALLLYLVWAYLKRSHRLYKNIIWVFLVMISLMISFLAEEHVTLSLLVSYLYPILFLSMVYGIGDRFIINRKQFIGFCNGVIVITLYASLYALIFDWTQFQRAIFISNAYGNELSSFFVSSHEYGLYLSAAIISCLFCLKLDYDALKWKKVFYFVAITIFLPNLILTFSRTSIFSMVLFLLTFIAFGRDKHKWWIIIFGIVTTIIVLGSPSISQFVFEIILKGNTTGGRRGLFNEAVNYFQNGSMMEKFFGYGIDKARSHFTYELGHGSVHNAYLQVLLYYGVAGLATLLIFLFSQLTACIRVLRMDRFMGTTFLGMLIMASAIMFTNTPILFTSSIDSYFLTMFLIIVPKYVRNSLYEGNFD